MPKLININQTSFVHERTMMETFLVVRELINFRNKHNIPSVVLKIDFRKAFDTISWDFLLQIMSSRGFSPIWVQWVRNLLISSSSVINGYRGDHFYHMRGLRQWDPLSPLLFVLITDTLQILLSRDNFNMAIRNISNTIL
jgi:Reverse transcriptase (RNA-dependent DNA polymerase)